MDNQDMVRWAWAAGLFDGEGHVSQHPYKEDWRASSWNRQMVLSMCDEDVVRRFHAVVGCGSVTRTTSKNERWQTQWRWRCTRWPDMERVMRSMLPFLGERRSERVREMLANPPQAVRGDWTHCMRGHEFTPDNIYWDRGGHRHCKTCAKARDKARWQRTLAARKADSLSS